MDNHDKIALVVFVLACIGWIGTMLYLGYQVVR